MSLADLKKKMSEAKASVTTPQRIEKLKAGKGRYKILPGKNDPLQFFHTYGEHWLDLGGEKKQVCACNYLTNDKPCEICSSLKKISSLSNSQEALKFVEDSKAKGYTLINVLDLNNSDAAQRVIPKTLALPKTAATGLFELFDTLIEAGIDPLSFEGGITVQFTKSGQGLETKYTVLQYPSPVEISKETAKKVMDSMKDLSEVCKDEDYEKVVARLNGMMGGVAIAGSKPVQSISDQRQKTNIAANLRNDDFVDIETEEILDDEIPDTFKNTSGKVSKEELDALMDEDFADSDMKL